MRDHVARRLVPEPVGAGAGVGGDVEQMAYA